MTGKKILGVCVLPQRGLRFAAPQAPESSVPYNTRLLKDKRYHIRRENDFACEWSAQRPWFRTYRRQPSSKRQITDINISWIDNYWVKVTRKRKKIVPGVVALCLNRNRDCFVPGPFFRQVRFFRTPTVARP